MLKGKLQAVHYSNGVSEGQIIGLDGSKVHFFGFKGKMKKSGLVNYKLYSPKDIVGLSSASKGPIASEIEGIATGIPSKLRKKGQGI